MIFRKAAEEELEKVQKYYWDLIDLMRNAEYKPGWEKKVYPSDEFLVQSLKDGDLFLLEDEEGIAASVIVNSETNEGYRGIKWQADLADEEVLVPHALGVWPERQGQGIGKKVVDCVIEEAGKRGKKAVRLDVLGSNLPAEKLYTGKGFQFIEAKEMYYEDTGWTEFRMFELLL